MLKTLKEITHEILLNDERLWNEDKTELNQTLLLDLVERIDEKIITLLLQEKDLREKFFVKIKDVYVFKINDFRFFMEENKVDNSYTTYKNRIGLTDGKRFIKDTNDAVLDFPYKDCVLEGGQSTEEGEDVYFEYKETTYKDKLDENGNKIKEGRKNLKIVDEEGHYEQRKAKRKEIFFNSVLAHDEIDRLFDPKAFVNWKRYTKEGEQKVSEIKRDEDGTIKENLIIKGNNLLALHSLKKQFAGKVKLIYIDPPYNTGSDSFAYNDKFNHSTWLTFMKNRLEISKQLLCNEGVIFIHIDDNEAGYFKVLCDDVFGKENFVNEIIITTNKPFGFKGTSDSLFKQANHIYMYAKNKQLITLNKGWIERDYDTAYNMVFNNFDKSEDEWTWESIDNAAAKSLGFENKANALEYITKEELEDKVALFALNNAERVFQTVGVSGGAFIKRKKTIEKSSKEREKLFRHPNDDMDYIFLKGRRVIFYKERLIELNGAKVPGELITDTWTDIAIEGIAKEGNVEFSRGKKPEKLISRILELASNENDIVLDFFAGSGTTGAVAHKMKRKYILCEQLDYVEELPINRIKGVLHGEQSGISKTINWQGGGEFLYCELAKWNETAKEKIFACDTLNELITFFNEMYERYFLNYNLKIKEFREKVINEEEFKKLSIEEQKKIFVAMLDNNQMYVNKTEMADKKFGISREDQNLTSEFYEEEM
jgi:adenine-specific DNA-methyltransferase